MYKIISFDEKLRRVKILYDDNSKNAMFSLMRYIKSKINAEMKEKDNGYLLFNEDKKYFFYIVENDALYIEVLEHDDKVAFSNFKYMEGEFKSYIEDINLIFSNCSFFISIPASLRSFKELSLIL